METPTLQRRQTHDVVAVVVVEHIIRINTDRGMKVVEEVAVADTLHLEEEVGVVLIVVKTEVLEQQQIQEPHTEVDMVEGGVVVVQTLKLMDILLQLLRLTITQELGGKGITHGALVVVEELVVE